MTEFRPMRRKRQQLSEAETIEILERATSGVLALMGDDGYPYTVPISYVYSHGRLLFHSAVSGHKVDAIRRCDKATFCVIDRDDVKPREFTTYFRSVICFGRVRILNGDAERREALALLAERYNPGDQKGFQHEMDKDFTRTLIISFDIEHITGKEAIELVRARRDNAGKLPE